jgi:hypothetical protein
MFARLAQYFMVVPAVSVSVELVLGSPIVVKARLRPRPARGLVPPLHLAFFPTRVYKRRQGLRSSRHLLPIRIGNPP